MSRKLDKAIAEALGYKDVKMDRTGLNPYYDGGFSIVAVPNFSTDGNDMLKLIEEMQNYFVSMETRECSASFYSIDKTDWCGVYHSDTLPKAVALAAYGALTGKDWEDEDCEGV